MAKKRMVSNQVVDSDAFLDMPLSAQALYLHLLVRADDEGFLNNVKKILRMIRASDDDLKILIAKNFVIMFESGVMVIKHWLIHNAIRKDRVIPTVHIDERAQLEIKSNDAYTLKELNKEKNQTFIETVSDKCQANDGHMSGTCQTNDRLEEIRLVQIRLEENRLEKNNTKSVATDAEPELPNAKKIDFHEIVKYWNDYSGLKNISGMTRKRKDFIRLRIKQAKEFGMNGIEAIHKVIDNCRISPFLQGDNDRGWMATFDWVFGKPSNFIKVLEGNYLIGPAKKRNNNDLEERAARLERQYGGNQQ